MMPIYLNACRLSSQAPLSRKVRGLELEFAVTFSWLSPMPVKCDHRICLADVGGVWHKGRCTCLFEAFVYDITDSWPVHA